MLEALLASSLPISLGRTISRSNLSQWGSHYQEYHLLCVARHPRRGTVEAFENINQMGQWQTVLGSPYPRLRWRHAQCYSSQSVRGNTRTYTVPMQILIRERCRGRLALISALDTGVGCAEPVTGI